jgi:hypothetical protein
MQLTSNLGCDFVLEPSEETALSTDKKDLLDTINING